MFFFQYNFLNALGYNSDFGLVTTTLNEGLGIGNTFFGGLNPGQTSTFAIRDMMVKQQELPYAPRGNRKLLRRCDIDTWATKNRI